MAASQGWHYLPVKVMLLQRVSPKQAGRDVAGKPALAGLQELLGPAVVEALGDALAAAQLSDADLAAQAVQDDPDLLFGRVTPARRPADVLDDLFRRQVGGAGFLSHLRSPEGYDEPEILPSSSR